MIFGPKSEDIKLEKWDVVKEFQDELTREGESCHISKVLTIAAHEVVHRGVD